MITSKDFLSFNDGRAEIYDVQNVSAPGDKPKEKLVLRVGLRFKNETMGLRRFFEAQQAKVDISRVISLPMYGAVSPQDIVIIRENGKEKQYRITLKQDIYDTRPPSMKLTLSDSEEKYEQ